MPKLSDSQLAANVRTRTRESVHKMRERHRAKGNVSLSVWVSAKAKAKAQALAREKGFSLGEVVALALERLDSAEVDATTHLMSSAANARRLTQAINDHRAGRNLQERELLADAD